MKPLSQLVDDALQHVADSYEAERQAEADSNYEFDLGFALRQIKGWKSRFFKKNSTHPATIRVITNNHLLDGIIHQKHTLQLFVKGKLLEQLRIRAEASDSLTRGLDSEVYTSGPSNSSEFCILHKYEPAKK
jgi:hypothetical protein